MGMIKKICKKCKKEFWVKPYRINSAIYCSRSCAGKDKVFSDITIQKLRDSRIGRVFSKETRRKISKALTGKKLSKKHRESLSKSHKGLIPWNKGTGKPKVKRLSASEAQKLRWDRIGRKPHKRYIHLSSTTEYRKWRSDVFTRDN